MEYTADNLPQEQLEKIQERYDLLKQIHGKTHISQERLSQALFQSLQDSVNQQIINHYLLQFFDRKQEKVDSEYRSLSAEDDKQWQKQAKFSMSGYKLNHFNDYAVVDIQQFLNNKNWNHLQVLDLSYCSIDNQGWKLLVDNAHLFLNLKVLIIYQNKIKQIRERDLQKFRSLKVIELQFNPLNYTSKEVLSRFVKYNPKIHVNY